MAVFLQPSLSGGELTPGLRGRVDLARYVVSLGKARNFITKPTGGGAKRPGQIFRGRMKYGDRFTRLIPFIYSTEVKYVVEAGDQYFRFWVNGALLTEVQKPISFVSNAAPAVVTVTGHGYQTGDHVLIENVQGVTRVNGRTYQINVLTADTFELIGSDTTGDPPYSAAFNIDAASRVVEVATPYTSAMLPQVRHTQSADVLYLTHGSVPIKELQRITATSFQLVNFDFRRGPFRGFNTDEAKIMAVSGTTGSVTVTTNTATFDPAMVGSLIYIEEKELRGVRPWASGEKNVPIGVLRRSDFKVYRASARASGGSEGTPYQISGATRPSHSVGRAWDGPGDVKNDGVNDYAVGTEWEFVHNTFGILQITGYTSPTNVTALVIERIPDSIVGTAPAPSFGPFVFSGNGVQTTFSPLTGITSTNPVDFSVTIGGAPQQPNPNYPGGGGVSGGGGGNPRPGTGSTRTFLE
jgi:hypothetical protein